MFEGPFETKAVVFWGEALEKLEAIYRRRKYGMPPGYDDLDAVLEHIMGPMERKKRCELCHGEGGQVGNRVDERGHTIQFEQCERCNGEGYVNKGQ